MAEEVLTVSVIIPHHNMHGFLPEAVESVVNQDYEYIELIIVDDGSDKSIDKAELSADKITLKLFEIPHSGKPIAVNHGLEHSSGDYITILDADDRLPEGSLNQRIKALQKSNADLCIGGFGISYNRDIQSVRNIDDFISDTNDNIIKALLTRFIVPFHQNAMLFNRELMECVARMNPQMLRSQDKDFAIRLLKKSKKTEFVHNPVYIYRRYNRPMLKRIRNRIMGMKYKLVVIYRYFSGWRKVVYFSWGMCIEMAKLCYNIFAVYKK